MALREDESVAIRPLRFLRTQPELVKVQRGDHLGSGERPAGMPGARLHEHPDVLDPQLAGLLVELLDQSVAIDPSGLTHDW
jgi:hypothetical protein